MINGGLCDLCTEKFFNVAYLPKYFKLLKLKAGGNLLKLLNNINT